MKATSLLVIVSVLGCSARGLTANDTSVTQVTVNGPLHLDVADFATRGGVLWALPSIASTGGGIVVESTRYGSLCLFDVSGSAPSQGNKIELHVRFDERLTQCTAEIRALRYTATISEAPGTYDVTVIHYTGTSVDTLRRQTVLVP